MKAQHVAAGTLLAALALAGCEPSATTTPGSEFDAFGLTTDYFNDVPDTLNVAGTARFVTVAAPSTNQGTNTRIGFVHHGAPISQNQEICTEWSGTTKMGTQPGQMLRWNGLDGIGFTQNIYGGVYDVVNLHVWNANEPHFTFVAQWKVTGLDGPMGLKPYPWTMCAKVVGDQASFKLWPSNELEPAYGDVAYSGQATINVMHTGSPATYNGHTAPGEVMAYKYLRETVLP